MMQKGPGEGYMAAKDDALAIRPDLKCRAVYWKHEVAGYVVEDDRTKPSIGKGTTARAAWNDALHALRTKAKEKRRATESV